MAFVAKKPLQFRVESSKKALANLVHIWKDPNAIFVNTDGSRSPVPHKNVIGGASAWIARSSEGVCLAKKAIFLPNIDDTLLLESYAPYHFTTIEGRRSLFHNKEVHFFTDSDSFLTKLVEVKRAREMGKNLSEILVESHRKQPTRDFSFVLTLAYQFCENLENFFASSSSVNNIFGFDNQVSDCFANMARFYFSEMSDMRKFNPDYDFMIQFPINVSNRVDFRSIRPFLPPIDHKSSGKLYWHDDEFRVALDEIIEDPYMFFLLAPKLRRYFNYPFVIEYLPESCYEGLRYFFDEMLEKKQSQVWIENIIPKMAKLVKNLPDILEQHYRQCDGGVVRGKSTGLRMFSQQGPGILFLDKELIGALLSCSFFCLFPTVKGVVKGEKQSIIKPFNMTSLFMSLLTSDGAQQGKNKLLCLCKYFERLDCSAKEFVSFERKVLSSTRSNPAPKAEFWNKSKTDLCSFKIYRTSVAEEHIGLEVCFIKDHFGGDTLGQGCGQEEIQFIVAPELIISMLLMPPLSEEESIEIVGAEKFSESRGYNDSFMYAGDYIDKRNRDSLHRRMTRVVALSAFHLSCREDLLREFNKAYCSFLVQTRYLEQHVNENVGVVTGSWGCIEDVQIQSIIQWAAASEASRPFVAYHTCGLDALCDLHKVVKLAESEKWTVGHIWRKLNEFIQLKNETDDFFSFILSR